MRTLVGVIGVGNMGKHHARVYRALAEICELVGVYDIDRARASVIADQYGVRSFDRLDDLLACVQAVSVVSPSHLHVEHGVRALDAGVNALIEKPVALTVRDAEPLRVASRSPSAPTLQAGHIEHFNPAIVVLRRLLSEMSLIALDIRRLSPLHDRAVDTDVVQDLMLHDIHVALTLDRSAVRHVQAAAAPWRTREPPEYAVAHLLFEDGVTASLSASRVTEAKVRHLSATTSDAYVTMDYLRRTIEVSRWMRFDETYSDGRAYRQESLIERIFVPEEEPLVAELRAFLESVRDGRPPDVDIDVGIRCLEVVDAIRAAVEHATSVDALGA